MCSDLLSTDAKPHFIKLDFINKGIDAVNLPSILRSKSVTETASTYFKGKEPPIISYTYTKTIDSKIFNFSSTLSDVDYHQFHNNPSQCECNTRIPQRAVLQKSCSTIGMLYGKLIALRVAGKRKCICWETFLENFLLNGHYHCEAAKTFLELWTIFENLLKLWMFLMKRT